MKSRLATPHHTWGVRPLAASASVATLAAILAACGSATPPSPTTFDLPDSTKRQGGGEMSTVQGQPSDANLQSKPGENEDYLYLADEITAAMVGPAAFDFESAEFRVGNFKVSLVESSQGSLPIVSFTPVDKADFYQVARCDSDATIEGADASLAAVESGGMTAAELIKAHLENSFWDTISAHPQCELISESLSRTAFIDQNPAQTAVNYAIRACSFVSAEKSQAGQICSQVVTISNTLPEVINRVRETVSELKTRITDLHSDVDAASVQLASKAREFAGAVLECEKTERRANITRHKKDLLYTLLGVGAKIGSYLLSGDSLNPFDALKSLWSNRQEIIKDASSSLLDLAKGVFHTEKESIKMCAQAELKSSEAALMVGAISEKTKAIADLVKNAIATGQTAP